MQLLLAQGVGISRLWVPEEKFGVSCVLNAELSSATAPATDLDHFGDQVSEEKNVVPAPAFGRSGQNQCL